MFAVLQCVRLMCAKGTCEALCRNVLLDHSSVADMCDMFVSVCGVYVGVSLRVSV